MIKYNNITNHPLNSFLVTVTILSIVFVAEAGILGLWISYLDLLIFIQIFLYLFLVFGAIVFFKSVKNKNDKTFVFITFNLAVVIRFVSVIIIYCLLYYLQGGPFQWGWGPDDYTYHKIALYFADHPDAALDDIYNLGLTKSYSLYSYITGWLYRIIYPHTLTARFFNALLNSLAIIPFYFFLKNLEVKKNVARLAVVFYIFSPAFIYFSCLELKDSLLLFIAFTLLYLASVISKTRLITKFAFLTILYIGLSLFFLYIRAQFFFLFVIFYFFILISNNRKPLYKSLPSFLPKLAIIIAIILIAYSQFLPFVSRGGETLTSSYISYEFGRYQKWHVVQLLGQLTPIITILIGFFMPFPTLVHLPFAEANYPTDLLKIPLDLEIFLSSFITMFVVFTKRIRREPGFKMLFIMALILYFGLLASNYITYERHRMLLTAFSSVFIAYGLEYGIRFKALLSISFGATLVVFFYNILRCVARGII